MEEDRRRRLLIIGGIVLLTIATIFVIYFLFFRSSETPPETTPPTFGTESGIRENISQARESDRTNQAGVFSPVARLRVLSEEPVSGAVALLTENAEIIRYNERETGHVFDIDLSDLATKRVSNTTIPRIYESLWAGDGSGLVLRYLADDNETIKTYYAALVEREDELREGETPYTLEGTFLQDNIIQFVLSPGKTRALWQTKTLQGSSFVTSNLDGTGMQTVFTTPFSEWIPQWFSSGTISLTTKASAYASGFSYTLPVSGGVQLSRTVGDIPGLTTLTSPAGRYVLYSEGTERSLSTFLYDSETGETIELAVSTMPEKCVWSSEEMLYCGVPNRQSATYPDAWYQGKIIFVDTIYSINPNTGRVAVLYSPLQTDSEEIDIYKPFISESGDYLIFNNKYDMSLWSFAIHSSAGNSFEGTAVPPGSGI